MLNKWVTMKEQFNKGNTAERRPFLSSEVTKIGDAEKWRLQIMREVTRKVAEIQNKGLGEHKIRDINDQINKLLREKGHWQHRVRELGGPDYNALEPKALDAEGKALPGGGGYKYFGAARDLPGVKELFARPEAVKRKRTRADMFKNVTPDYYGFRDDDDDSLEKAETTRGNELRAEALAGELAARETRRQKRREQVQPDGAPAGDGDSSDDNLDDEAAIMAHVDQAHAETTETLEHMRTARTLPKAADALASKKASLLKLFVDHPIASEAADEE